MASPRKGKLLYVMNKLLPYGGAAAVGAWLLEGAKRHWDITVLCAEKPDWSALNRHFGTQLSEQDFTVKPLPFPLSILNRLDPDPFSMQRLSWVMLRAQLISDQYDVVVGTEDEINFGVAGIQYTHFPHMQLHKESLQQMDGKSAWDRIVGLFTGKVRPWLAVSGMSIESIMRNRVICNSHWTAGVIKDIYKQNSKVVYPPVHWNGPSIDWAKRDNRFVALGRLSSTKRYPEIIDILARVRQRGHDVELDIIGDVDAVDGVEHLATIRTKAEQAGDWCQLHVSISRQELENRVARCRYAIHGMIDEHFGIAPAELVRGGCIVFVPNSGGQVEIVGEHMRLRYTSDDDAVDKICAVLTNSDIQRELRSYLDQRKDLFTEQYFMNAMNSELEEFAKRRKGAQG